MPSPLGRGNAVRSVAPRSTEGHISKFAGITCIVLAVLVDMLQALLVLLGALSGAFSVTLIGLPLSVIGIAMTFLSALVLSTLAYLAFGFYFLFGARIRFLTGKRAVSRLGALFGSFVFELAPFLNGFPWFTAGVVHIVQSAWQEEAESKRKADQERWKVPGRGEAGTLPKAANDNTPASRPVPRVSAPPKKEIPKPRKFAA